MESTHEILDKIHKAAQLIRKGGEVKTFKDNFEQIRVLVADIPGHEELVEVNELTKVEDWQVMELRNSLLEQLNKTKLTFQALLKTGYDA